MRLSLVTLLLALGGCYHLDRLDEQDIGANVGDGGGIGDGGDVGDGSPFGDGGFAPTRLDVWAGVAGGNGSCNGQGTLARFDQPSGVAVDNNGIVYVTDTEASTISTIDAQGNVTIVAGVPYQTVTKDGPFGTNRLAAPKQATYLGGKIYFAEFATNRVRAFDPATKDVTTIAGDSNTNAVQTVGITTDGTSLYVTQAGEETVYSLAPAATTPTLTLLAGTVDTSGYEEGTGTIAALFNEPLGIAWSSSGQDGDTLFVTDSKNAVIRAISPTKSQTTMLAAGAPGQSCKPLCFPVGIAAANSKLYVTDEMVNTLSSFDLTKSYPMTSTVIAGQLATPEGLAYSPQAQGLYIAERGRQSVGFYSTTNELVSNVAGSPGVGGITDGKGAGALFHNPAGIVATAQGVVVADFTTGLLRRVDANANVKTIANMQTVSGCGIAAGPTSPTALAVASDGTIYATDSAHNDIVKLDPSGTLSIVCDATTAAPLGQLKADTSVYTNTGLPGIALDGDQDLYVADAGNNRIQHLHLDTHTVETVQLGEFPTGCSSTPGPNLPYGIAIDHAKHLLYGTSYGNCVVFSVPTMGGAVNVIAGNGQGSTDGTLEQALFYHPGAIALDPSGTLYVSDYGNSTIRAIDPNGEGKVSTLAGVVNQFGVAPGLLSEDGHNVATLNRATGLALYPGVGLIVADWVENTLLVIH